MKERTNTMIAEFFERHDNLKPLQAEIVQAGEMLLKAFQGGNQLLLCGNGGSCADCDHIVGEFLKGFMLKRPVNAEVKQKLAQYGAYGEDMGNKLQCGLPAISLTAHAGAISAFANDVDPELVYAQQVLAYGKPGDVLIGISTSGGAGNVAAAVMVANSLGMHTVGLTGKDGGKLGKLAQLPLIMPQCETYRIQEDHLAVYHLLCAVVESEMFEA